MTKRPMARPARLFLGMEGGATKTVALLANEKGDLLKRLETGPANLRLVTDAQLLRHFRTVAAAFTRPSALGIGLAGAREPADFERILRAAAQVWPGIPCHAANDLETALAAAEDVKKCAPQARVIVLSGTGSCCYGRNPAGQTVKVGGWGHLLGDKGSGYEIGLRALKAVVYYFDRDGVWPGLGQSLLRELELNEPNDFMGWAHKASKGEIASLALMVFDAWQKRDKIAADILEGAAHSLAKDAVACARRLAQPGAPVQFVLAGSVLLRQPRFARRVTQQIAAHWPAARVAPLKLEGAWGAVRLAREHLAKVAPALPAQEEKSAQHDFPRRQRAPSGRQPAPPAPSALQHKIDVTGLEGLESSPTEQRNPRSANLHRLPLSTAIELMLSEEAGIPRALLAERKKIERAIRLVVRAFRRGGRLFYVGAGTSGRLGVLDASECPPTFGAPPEQVQGIMAGGPQALWRSVEGAEDDAQAGARAVAFRGVTAQDVVAGIAASGRTPFVWGALLEAKRRRAKTILLSFNPRLKIPAAQRPALVIAPDIGPEVLTGSTRLKAGTATKLVLNMLTTLSMVKLGKVIGNLMVDLNASNAKLRDRAVRMVGRLAQCDYATARLALEQSGWLVKKAWQRLRRTGRRRVT
ncbi:MAG: N-acetylmuramic acid 6-phosphate etherase [Chloroflexi bacterium]|nr:N-acetylmuramic acid 6-phosphate etherase [Chloroflexota bacterium]